MNVRDYFERLKNQSKTYASAQIIIGLDGEIIRCIPEDEVAYHAGEAYMNNHSIGVEMCCWSANGDTSIHGDWRINEATIKSAIEYIKDRINKYQLEYSAVIRHFDVTGKTCPQPFVNHPEQWEQFQNRIKEGIMDPQWLSKEVKEWALKNKIATQVENIPDWKQTMLQISYNMHMNLFGGKKII